MQRSKARAVFFSRSIGFKYESLERFQESSELSSVQSERLNLGVFLLLITTPSNTGEYPRVLSGKNWNLCATGIQPEISLRIMDFGPLYKRH